MKLRQIIFLLLLVHSCLVFSSCSPSKEASLRRYERFINNIQENHNNFIERDWKNADRRMKNFNNVLMRRLKNKLTQEEKNYISNTIIIYNSYRNKDSPDETEDFQGITGSANGVNDRMDELRKLAEYQAEITLQLERLQRQILEEQRTPNKTQEELLIDKLQNDLLMEMLTTKKQGRPEIYGRIKVLILPTNYNGNVFRMNYNNLTPTIQEAINIIISQARKYNQNISIDWDYGSNVSINNSTEALRYYSQYKNNYHNYQHFVLVYAVDKIDRSFYRYSYEGSLANIVSSAIVWFKDNSVHSAGVLAHEIFHVFGAEDLYYEQGVVPKEVESNFKTLLGNSIMITSDGSSGLDPINAWLMGWNKTPEPWYAWFIDKRDNTVKD